MSQQVTNEELEAYWDEVAHAADVYNTYGKETASWFLSRMIGTWQLELTSRCSNLDTP